MIKIDFERNTKHGIYRDAITLPADSKLTENEVGILMQQRVDNWVAYMDNPPQSEPEPEFFEIDGVKYAKVG